MVRGGRGRSRAKVPRPALGVELHARATDRVRHCRGVGNARGHRALGEDVSAGLGRGDKLKARSVPSESRQQHASILDAPRSRRAKAFVVAVDADARDGRRLSQCGLSQLLGAGLVVASTRRSPHVQRRVRRCVVRLNLDRSTAIDLQARHPAEGRQRRRRRATSDQPGVDVGVQAGDGSAAGESNTDSWSSVMSTSVMGLAGSPPRGRTLYTSTPYRTLTLVPVRADS